jgi:hypothetical protein
MAAIDWIKLWRIYGMEEEEIKQATFLAVAEKSYSTHSLSAILYGQNLYLPEERPGWRWRSGGAISANRKKSGLNK